MKTAPLFESLESRTMMSATPVLFDRAVVHDRLEVQIELAKLNVDLYADAKTLSVDNRALKADDLHGNTVLAPLVTQLRSDVQNFKLILKGDRLTEAGNVISAEKVILGDIKTYISDKGNATARTAEAAQLKTDRASLQTAMVNGLTQRITDRESETTTLSDDEQAILTALPTSGASAQLTTDVTAWLTDKADSLSKITADLAQLSADRTQLIADLSAD